MSLPASLALESVGASSGLVSAPVRDNFTDIQAAVNGLITFLQGEVVIRGGVSSLGALTKGSGFTSAKTGTGIYTVTFSVAFDDPPIIVAWPTAAGTGSTLPAGFTNGITVNGATIQFFVANTVAAVDAPFDFIAYAA